MSLDMVMKGMDKGYFGNCCAVTTAVLLDSS